MEKKSNKGMYAIIGVLAALAAAAIIIVLVLLFKDEEKNKSLDNISSSVSDEISKNNNNTNNESSFENDSEPEILSKKTNDETAEMSMSYSGKKITASFNIPDGFNFETEDNSEGYATQTFLTDDVSVTVDNYIFASEEYYNNAEGYVAASVDWIKDEAPENSDIEIKTMDINGNKYYYAEASYNYSNSQYQKVFAACDISDSEIYALQAVVIDEDINLSIDTVKDFLTAEFKSDNT